MVVVRVLNRSTVGPVDGDVGVVAIFNGDQRSLFSSLHRLEAFVDEDRGMEGEGDVGVGDIGVGIFADDDVVGRRAGGHAVEGHGAPLAVVAGEGQHGVLDEGGGEGHGLAHGEGGGVAEEVGDSLVDGAPGADVGAVNGGGHNLHRGAGDDKVLAFGGGGDDAVAAGRHAGGVEETLARVKHSCIIGLFAIESFYTVICAILPYTHIDFAMIVSV